ncbi:Eukaryotic translation initiation factor 2 subunit beta [Wickerhamomyces ciferrii]|uniref:Eukaryotic translation initiation factor 2 subunit beta n=1 Tax=Wickerhamomyces ciferrii (strain ATCC 14091 / BCRC 22168 / CBS 111 / JCM 3599 / NBRC 0793 / NRRL Y-1031 F-60-10) TaxID=1206466 RepID=K0KUI6_WICCF|nr:Eukaryotic translation initiation factor 2 subunit beta [Wickerhamomyces ciferrii]CCH45094.1 Eukaryotic translation initiation factor 2 subunit beta [Wickerhamomyces ciferrii]
MSVEETNVDLGFDPTLKKKKKKSTKTVEESNEATPEVDDVLSGLKKKKKKSKDSKSTPDADEINTDDVTDSLGELKLKKKKKKSSTPVPDDDFDKQLEKLGLDETNTTNTNTAETITDDDVNAQQSKYGLPYDGLLSRFFQILKKNNPELAGERSGTKFKIPPPVCQREGNKKTAFANVQEISEKLQRSPEHLISYLFAELGTSGSVDGQKRLIIKGRFQPKQLENVLRRYIIEYVTCKTCKSINTQLKKESSNRLFFLVCNSCGSTRSVSSIKTGFSAQIGKRKKM